MIEPLARLAVILARLPGIGRRSAERIAFRLAREPGHSLARDLAAALDDIPNRIRLCSRCGALTGTDRDPCALCEDPRRDSGLLCVVGQPGDIDQIESSGAFRGRYHVLAGRLSPMRGEDLTQPLLARLAERLDREPFREVILALDTDVESDATATWLKEWLAPRSLRVSRLAFGLPAGSGIAYTDSLTLARALDGRRDV